MIFNPFYGLALTPPAMDIPHLTPFRFDREDDFRVVFICPTDPAWRFIFEFIYELHNLSGLLPIIEETSNLIAIDLMPFTALKPRAAACAISLAENCN